MKLNSLNEILKWNDSFQETLKNIFLNTSMLSFLTILIY